MTAMFERNCASSSGSIPSVARCSMSVPIWRWMRAMWASMPCQQVHAGGAERGVERDRLREPRLLLGALLLVLGDDVEVVAARRGLPRRARATEAFFVNTMPRPGAAMIALAVDAVTRSTCEASMSIGYANALEMASAATNGRAALHAFRSPRTDCARPVRVSWLTKNTHLIDGSRVEHRAIACGIERRDPAATRAT